MIDRFGQIEPKVLLTVAGYRYQGRHHDIKRIFRIRSVTMGIREHANYLVHLKKGTGPSMRDDQRKGIGCFSTHMHKMNGVSIHVRLVLGEFIENVFLFSPIKIVQPVADQVFQVALFDSIIPTTFLDLIWPTSRLEASAQIIQDFLPDGYLKSFHGFSPAK